MQLLLDHGADRNGSGGLPLAQAGLKCRADVAEVLVSHGANPNLPDPRSGNTVLHYAAWKSLMGGNFGRCYDTAEAVIFHTQVAIDWNLRDSLGLPPIDDLTLTRDGSTSDDEVQEMFII